MKKMIGLLFLYALLQLPYLLYADDNSKTKTKTDIKRDETKYNFTLSALLRQKQDIKEDKEEEVSTNNENSLTDFEKEQLRIQEEQLRLQKAMLFFQMMQSMSQPQYSLPPSYQHSAPRRPQQQQRRCYTTCSPSVIHGDGTTSGANCVTQCY